MKYVYGEGVVSRSKHNLKVITGELPRRQALIYREAWVPWKYYANRTIDFWMTRLERIPFVKRLVFEVYEVQFYPVFLPEERETIAYIDWSKLRPDRRERWRVHGDEEVSPARSEPEG